MTGDALLSEELPGGASRTLGLGAGNALRLTALGSRPAVSALVFAARDPLERLNLPDTLKAQQTAWLAPGHVLMSDMGRALLRLSGSSLAAHDAIGGHSLDADVLARYGPSSFGAHRNGWRRSAREGFLRELAKHGLGRRDLHGTVNLFALLAPADDARGTLRFVPDHAGEGDWVTLRAEQDVLLVLANVPHPVDPRPDWQPAALRLECFADPGPHDLPVSAEARRALEELAR